MKKDKLVKIEPITEGWSADQKYCAMDEDGSKYLLRIVSEEQARKKKLEFEMMQEVSKLGIPMCLPIEFGSCEEGVYTLHSWIHGEAADKVITIFSGTVSSIFIFPRRGTISRICDETRVYIEDEA